MIRKRTVIGLMSGTSLDGVDAALVDFWEESGRIRHRLRNFLLFPIPDILRADLKRAMVAGTIADYARLNREVGLVLSEAAMDLVASAHITLDEVDLVGTHGQTIWHDPGKASVQIGEPSLIAERTGITTVFDFRAADIAAGGQGAPLVPYADQELYGEAGLLLGLLNIGGIANLTVVDGRPDEKGVTSPRATLAFDTGPGNVLIDALCDRIWKEYCDRDGHHAATGKVHGTLLRELSGNAYFQKSPPKSTGREVFGDAMVAAILSRAVALKIPPEDIVATVTALTAFAVADAVERFVADRPTIFRVSGGGARNPILMKHLKRVLGESSVAALPAADEKEAIAFALFAYRAAFGQVNHVPITTGATHRTVLGKFAPGVNFERLLTRDSRLFRVTSSQATESRHRDSTRLDCLSSGDLADLMIEEEFRVAHALGAVRDDFARAIDVIVERMRRGGRLFYVGAGTSGRLGVLDAAECPPTFSTSTDAVIGLIAGGSDALVRAVEGAEDDEAAGAADLMTHQLCPADAVVGISASGLAPYVHGALKAARLGGCATLLLTANAYRGHSYIDQVIAPIVGAEILSGSTRLKAGTMTKVALNILSTGVMVRLGKCYGNLMVDLQVSNAKLRQRAAKILEIIAGVPATEVADLLLSASGSVKVAIAMRQLGCSETDARQALEAAQGSLRALIGDEVSQ